MISKNRSADPETESDPFEERSLCSFYRHFHLLGCRVRFESNSAELIQLVDAAYAGLPRHALKASQPEVRVKLIHSPTPSATRRSEPPPLEMYSAAGLLGGATARSDFMLVSQRDRSAIVKISQKMLQSPYHTRYELIEFAVFTLVCRVQHMVPLHSACVSIRGRAVLLLGPSGAGKSTVALHCLMQGMDFVSEDSVFVVPNKLLVTGVPNFLHIRVDSLSWLAATPEVAALRKSPIITRRSGVKKLEIDLRGKTFRLAPRAPAISAVVFLSPKNSNANSLLDTMSSSELINRLERTQAYSAAQPEWRAFSKAVAKVPAYELFRGRHPLDAVESLRSLLKKAR
jgi:hypothetical protein